MSIHALFPTLVYAAALQRANSGDFNRQLLKECRQLRLDDAAGGAGPRKIIRAATPRTGRRTVCKRSHQLSSRCAKSSSVTSPPSAAAVEWDLRGRELEMTDCWVNIMPQRHGAHTAPASALDLERHLLRTSAQRIARASSSKTRAWIDSWRRRRASRPRAARTRPWVTYPAAAGRSAVRKLAAS